MLNSTSGNICEAIHPDPDSGGGSGVRVSIGRAALRVLGRAFDFVAVAAVEFALRGDLLRGVSAAAATAACCQLEARDSGCVCSECDGGRDSRARVVVARLWAAEDRCDSTTGVAARMFIG